MRFAISTAFTDPGEVLALARAADALGYDALSVPDHVVNLETLTTPYPYTPDGERRWPPFTPWLDPWVAIGSMAAVTERLRFFTGVYVLPMRNPLVVAKAVGTAAVLSGNRVALGIGVGWCEEEFDLMEQRFARRGARTDEMLELLDALWQPGWVEHHGAGYDIPRLEMSPVPTERVPIYVGGTSDVALRRAARHDGWISDYLTIEGAFEARARLDQLRAEAGRSDEPFAVIASVTDAVVADDFRRAEEAGVTDILTMPWAYYSGFEATLDQKIDGMTRFAEDVIAPLAEHG
jgi:probable F420-dependent oxidoreductase